MGPISARRRGRALATGAAFLGAGILWSRYCVPHAVPLPPALSGKRRIMHTRVGPVSVYSAGPQSGRPDALLLVHSINAAASAFEVRPLYEPLQSGACVYAPDLPGFGFSPRTPRRYDVPLYVAALRGLLQRIAADSGTAADLLACSLSCEFAARIACQHPELVRSLILVSPTGRAQRDRLRAGAPGPTPEVPGLEWLVGRPLWSRALYDALTSRPSLELFLRRTFGSASIDPGLAAYDWLTAHQPGAEHAVWAFLSGRLFSREIQGLYSHLTQPVLVLHGRRGAFADLSGADRLRRRSNWTFCGFDTGALPHFEQPEAVLRVIRGFLDGVASAVRTSQRNPAAARTPGISRVQPSPPGSEQDPT